MALAMAPATKPNRIQDKMPITFKFSFLNNNVTLVTKGVPVVNHYLKVPVLFNAPEFDRYFAQKIGG
jgi:hypothetical protein